MPKNYQPKTWLFVICMMSLVLCLMSIFFSFYILFDLFFGWVTNPPAFIYRLEQWLISEYFYSEGGADFIILISSIVSAIFFAALSFITSKKVERDEGIISEDTTEKDSQNFKESLNFGGKIFIIIVAVLFLVLLIQRNFFGF